VVVFVGVVGYWFFFVFLLVVVFLWIVDMIFVVVGG